MYIQQNIGCKKWLVEEEASERLQVVLFPTKVLSTAAGVLGPRRHKGKESLDERGEKGGGDLKQWKEQIDKGFLLDMDWQHLNAYIALKHSALRCTLKRLCGWLAKDVCCLLSLRENNTMLE